MFKYEESQLIQRGKYLMCPNCLDADDICECFLENPEEKGLPLEVRLYVHCPPKLDGLNIDDDECAACKLSLAASEDHCKIHMCEKTISQGDGICPSFSQVQFCIEQMESVLKVRAKDCGCVITRDEVRLHKC